MCIMSTRLAGDPSGMMAAALGLPDHLGIGAAAAQGVGRFARGVHEVLVCGMGGSALPGDFLELFAAQRHVRVTVSRDYAPSDAHLGPHVLAICSSYSGETEETLAAFDCVHAAGCRVVTVSAGGQLATRSAERGVAHVRLERPSPTFQPRAATGYFYGAFVTLLEDAGLLDGASAALSALAAGLRSLPVLDAEAQDLARALAGRVPLIYATAPFVQTAARVAKIKLNENAKIPAFFNALPELNHNELVGFTQPIGPFSAVLLRDPDLTPHMVRRFEATVETLRDVGVPAHVVPMVDGTADLKLFAALRFFDAVSIYLAINAGLDPTPVTLIEAFKRRLAAQPLGPALKP